MRILLFTGFYLSDLKTTGIRRAIGTDARIAVTNDLDSLSLDGVACTGGQYPTHTACGVRV